MNYIQEERDALTQTVGQVTGFKSYAHVPERFTAPAAFCVPGSPYVEEGASFGEHKVNFEVWLVVATGTIEFQSAALDEVISESIIELIRQGWSVQGVDEPILYQVQNTQHLAVILRVQTGIRFNQ